MFSDRHPAPARQSNLRFDKSPARPYTREEAREVLMRYLTEVLYPLRLLGKRDGNEYIALKPKDQLSVQIDIRVSEVFSQVCPKNEINHQLWETIGEIQQLALKTSVEVYFAAHLASMFYGDQNSLARGLTNESLVKPILATTMQATQASLDSYITRASVPILTGTYIKKHCPEISISLNRVLLYLTAWLGSEISIDSRNYIRRGFWNQEREDALVVDLAKLRPHAAMSAAEIRGLCLFRSLGLGSIVFYLDKLPSLFFEQEIFLREQNTKALFSGAHKSGLILDQKSAFEFCRLHYLEARLRNLEESGRELIQRFLDQAYKS